MRVPHNKTTQSKAISRRAFTLLGVQAAFVGVLGLRMRQLGIKQADEFRLLAEENRINTQLVPPSRGIIYDRNGTPIATNIPLYQIQIVREQTKEPEKILRKLAEIIPITEYEIQQALTNISKRRPWVPVTVTENLEWAHVAAVSANAPSLPGITPIVGAYRHYPQAHEFCHVVGYVGPVSDYDLSQTDDDDPLLRIPRFQIGKNGIETRTDLDLRGKAEIKRIEVNAFGRVMREVDSIPGEPGKNLQLTIDSTIQNAALRRIRSESAAVVVMDVRNGDILALASAPSFDPNKFVTGISVPDWKELNENKYRPLANKTVSGTYPPGSTYKMIVALAALEAGVIDSTETVRCFGHTKVGGRRFHCWKRGGHGSVNMVRSLRESCDVYYYEIAERVGIDKISDVARRLGLGTRHDLPLPAIREGLAPTTDWKRQVKGKEWLIGDTLNAGIGQGYTLASPLQLAIMTARISSGKKILPRMINTVGDDLAPIDGNEPLDFNPAHLDIIRRGMYEVVNSSRGTARGSRLKKKDLEMAGKTGTSQVRNITKAERARGVFRNKDLPWERRDHALFVGYAPFVNPKYAISVIVEHGGGGSKAAAPIAKDVMLATLERNETGYGQLPSRKRHTDDPDQQTPQTLPTQRDRA